MRFATAWADVFNQNINLKFGLIALGLSTVVLSITSTRLAFKAPLVIERSCYAKALELGDASRNQSEIQSFVELALAQRFNSKTLALNSHLSPKEVFKKEREQKELKGKKMNQSLFVNNIESTESDIKVNADRLISVGEIRSAFPFHLVVKLESIERSHDNPYGLLLVSVEEVKSKESK